MNVIGGIILFMAGAMIGGSAVYYNQYSIRRATASLRRENEKLKHCAMEDALRYTEEKAYRDGYHEGRKSPMRDAERFAESFEGLKNVRFGGEGKKQEG